MPMFRMKDAVVEARQVTREDGPAIAIWCNGQWLTLYGRGDRGEDISHVTIREGGGYLRAELGDWVIRLKDHTHDTFKPAAFALAFEAVEEARAAAQVPPLGVKLVQALNNVRAYVRDMDGVAGYEDDDQLIATAPPVPPDGGSQGMITIGDLRVLVDLHSNDRWNVHEEGDDLLICRGHHDKGEDCSYERFVPEGATYRLQDHIDDLAQERAKICLALGCVDKPGVPLEFILKLMERSAKAHAREVELIRSWDKASLTERQELDQMRRGWGPSTPTERNRRHADVLGCLSVLSSAMAELAPAENTDDYMPEAASNYLDAAYELLDKRHTEMLVIVEALNKEPMTWPDIEAAEERGGAKYKAERDSWREHAAENAVAADRLARACFAARQALLPFAALSSSDDVMTNHGTSIKFAPAGSLACGLTIPVSDLRRAEVASRDPGLIEPVSTSRMLAALEQQELREQGQA